MMSLARMLVCLMALLGAVSVAGANPLRAYVHEDDGSFDYEVVESFQFEQTAAYNVRLTSQKWQEKTWWHWLSVLVPEQIRHPGKGIIVVGGGSNRDEAPPGDIPEAELLATMAAGIGVPVAIVQQVPNQPLFDNLREDALIAKTFDEFFREEGESDWPLLMPMTKSVVRAMDAVDALVREKHGQAVEQFVVGGGSKRGWTSYLTAAVDPRVIGVVPVVIDILNFQPQVDQQLRSYGEPSVMIRDYTERGLLDRIETPRGQELMSIVDPYRHRERMQMPKLVMLGTNDPYWTVDAANLYFEDLPAPRYLHYGMNVGHDVSMGSIPTMLAFFEHVLADEPLPELNWQQHDDGSLTVSWNSRARRVYLVHAGSSTRDFRDVEWQRDAIDFEGDSVQVALDTPTEGFRAYYVDVEFELDNPQTPTFRQSTAITVLPDEFPY